MKIKHFFSIKQIRYDIIRLVSSSQLYKFRKSISQTKNITYTIGSTRKIYKQKGLGKARHGSLRAVQFRGGGIVFGPNKNKKYIFRLNKKLIKMAMINILLLKFYTNSIKILNLRQYSLKTKGYIARFKSCKRLLFLGKEFDKNFVHAIENIHNFKLLKIVNLNTLDLLRSDSIYILKNSLKNILKILKS